MWGLQEASVLGIDMMCARVAHYSSSKNINLTSLSLRPSNSKLQTPAHHKQIGIFESSPQRACVDSDVASFNITPATQLMLNLDVFLASNGPCTNSLKIYSSTTWEDVVQDSYKRRKTHCQRACAEVHPRTDLDSWKGGKQIIGQFPGWIEVILRQLAMSGHFRVISLLKYSTFWGEVMWPRYNSPGSLRRHIDLWEIFLHPSARRQDQRLVGIQPVIWAKRLFGKKIDRVF